MMQIWASINVDNSFSKYADITVNATWKARTQFSVEYSTFQIYVYEITFK